MKKLCFLFVLLIVLSLIPSVRANPDGWVSPTGFIDPDNAWSDEVKAYDENTATFAVTSNVYQDVWTPYLHLTLSSAIQCSKVRFYISTMALAWEALKISVYKDDLWVEVYNEAFPPPDKWNEVEFSQGSVSEAKVSVKPHGFFGAVFGRLNEFDFWEIEEAPPEEYFFSFSETMNVSASSYFWKAKMFSGTETVSISSDSNIWKEKGFYMTETVTVNDVLNVLKAKLLSITETMSSTSSFYSTFEVVEEEREEDGGSGGGFLYPIRKPLALFAVIIVLILGYFWISPESQERKEARKPKPTVKPRKHIATLKPRSQKSTTKPRKHIPTLEPRKHKKTTKQRKHKKTVKPRKHKR